MYIAFVKRQHVAHYVEALLMLSLVACSILAKGIILFGLSFPKVKGVVKIFEVGIGKYYFSYGVPRAFSFT